MFFFGGGWANRNPTRFEPFARHVAGVGRVAVCADYRVSSRHKTTPADAVRDAKSAVRYAREHATGWGADPNRVVAAGGHLAACAALVPGFRDGTGAKDADAAPNAMVLFNPVVDTSAAGLGGAKRGDGLKPISPPHHVRHDGPVSAGGGVRESDEGRGERLRGRGVRGTWARVLQPPGLPQGREARRLRGGRAGAGRCGGPGGPGYFLPSFWRSTMARPIASPTSM